MNEPHNQEIAESTRVLHETNRDDVKNAFLESNLSLRLLAKDTLLYGVVAGFSRATAIILVPMLTRSLSVNEFGVVDTLLLVSNVALLLGNAGVDSALLFYYYHVPESEKGTYVATGIWIRLLIGVMVTVIAVSLAPVVSGWVFGTEQYSFWTSLAFLFVPTTLVMTYGLDILRIERERSWFVILSALRVVVLVTGTLIVLQSFGDKKVDAFLMFRIVPDALLAITLVFLLARRYTLSDFSMPAAKEILAYGAPFVPAVVMYWGLGFVDRWFLFQNVSGNDVGVYALAVKMGLILTLFSTAIQMAFNPYSMAVKDHEKSADFYSRAFALTMTSACVLFVFLGANLEFLITLFGGSDYSAAGDPAVILLMANVSYMGYVFFATGSNVKKKTIYNVCSFGAALAAAIVLTAIFVPLWGIMGAAVAILVANATLAGVALYFSQKVHHIPYNVTRVLMGALLCAGIVVLMRLLSSPASVVSYVTNNMLALGSAFALVKVMLTRDQGHRLWQRFGFARLNS